jgi:hypothetical protein
MNGQEIAPEKKPVLWQWVVLKIRCVNVWAEPKL